jgi:hypothetical protein
MGFRQSTLRIATAAVFGVLLVATTSISAQAKPAPPGPGNSPSAQKCYQGGWQNLATSTGATFASQDACVSYASHGGVLAQKRTVTLTLLDQGTNESGAYCVATFSVTGFAPSTAYTAIVTENGNPGTLDIRTDATGSYNPGASDPNAWTFFRSESLPGGSPDWPWTATVTVDGVSSPSLTCS